MSASPSMRANIQGFGHLVVTCSKGGVVSFKPTEKYASMVSSPYFLNTEDNISLKLKPSMRSKPTKSVTRPANPPRDQGFCPGARTAPLAAPPWAIGKGIFARIGGALASPIDCQASESGAQFGQPGYQIWVSPSICPRATSSAICVLS